MGEKGSRNFSKLASKGGFGVKYDPNKAMALVWLKDFYLGSLFCSSRPCSNSLSVGLSLLSVSVLPPEIVMVISPLCILKPTGQAQMRYLCISSQSHASKQNPFCIFTISGFFFFFFTPSLPHCLNTNYMETHQNSGMCWTTKCTRFRLL